ncbi:MAG: hypothetical protein JW943_10520 [Deltaproteobacteria bacterium]|nr:hypothetical protein [Deltaproteobacteria bacterium]
MTTRFEEYPLRYLARVVIEFRTAFLIGNGQNNAFADEVFVSDANGLPALPGSSIAGILRRQLSETDANDIFGNRDASMGSRLTISWGCIHDSHNRPVEGLVQLNTIEQDTVLRQAKYSMVRDHVCINRRGTAVQGGKFDERCVDAGHRFTFEMILEGNAGDESKWTILMSALTSNELRFGGKTRRGYGAFDVVHLKTQMFNLSNPAERDAYLLQPKEFAIDSAMLDRRDLYAATTRNPETISLTIPLEPQGFWMVGGGSGTAADMTPVEASRIVWDEQQNGSVKKVILIPGTAIKGPLSHRVAYYYNALNESYADCPSEIKPAVGAFNGAVRCLFGSAKNDKHHDPGEAGRIYIDDIYIEQTNGLEAARKIINHVSIDRFTGGSRAGALFSEQPIYQGGPVQLRITITEKSKIIEESNVKEAFNLAIKDLKEEQLAIGSGDGRGNGYFKSSETVSIPW